jgi:hypothetical protein
MNAKLLVFALNPLGFASQISNQPSYQKEILGIKRRAVGGFLTVSSRWAPGNELN